MAEYAVEWQEVDDGGVVGGPWIETKPKGRGLGAARALLAGMALIMVGNGLQGAVLGVRAENEGFGLAVSGAVMAAYFLGFLFGARLAEHFLGAVGHIRVFAALASVASAVSILHPLWVNPPAWIVLRVISGLAMAGLYVTVESWLNDMGTNANRGRLLGTYSVVTMGGLSAGQLLLNGGDPAEFELYIFSSALISVALVPIALSATSAPPLVAPEPLPLRRLIGLVPTGVLTAFCAGTSHGALLGVGAVYAAREGLPASRIALFLSVATLGALVFTLPIGALSDRMSRRVVIFGVAAVAAGVAGVMALIEPGSGLSLGLMFLFGGTTFPLYSLAITHTADWVPSSPAQRGQCRTGAGYRRGGGDRPGGGRAGHGLHRPVGLFHRAGGPPRGDRDVRRGENRRPQGNPGECAKPVHPVACTGIGHGGEPAPHPGAALPKKRPVTVGRRGLALFL